MIGVFAAEWLKIWKRAATLIVGAIWFVLVLGLGYIVPYIVLANVRGPKGQPVGGSAAENAAQIATLLPRNVVHAVVTGGFGIAGLGGMLMLILAALVGGGEYGWGTLKTLLTQRPGRLTVFGGKLLAIALLLLIFVAIGFIGAIAGSLIVALFDHATVTWPPFADVAKGFGASLLILGAWTAVGLGLAELFKGTGLAIGLGLVYALIIESLVRGFSGVSDIVKNVSTGLLGTNVSALAGSFPAASDTARSGGRGGFGADLNIGAGQASCVLALYVLAFVVLAAVLLRQRDVA